MKKLFIASFALLALTFIAPKAFASHIAGADISCRYIGEDPNQPGANLYILTLNLFRDCQSAAGLGTSQGVCRFNDCGISDNYILPLVSGYPIDVSAVCDDPMWQSDCNGGTVPGYEHFRFQDTISMDIPDFNVDTCSKVTFGWYGFARNAGIANILNSSSQGIHTQLEYFWANDATNSTPEFIATFPIPYKCYTPDPADSFGIVPQTISFAALEIEGDLLSYDYASAAGGSCPGRQDLAYINTNNGGSQDHSPMNAFASPSGTVVNPTSGIVTFRPYAPGFYVMVVEVTERDAFTNQILSRTIRDIQVVVENCAGNLAPNTEGVGITNLQGQAQAIGPLTLDLCVGESFSFDLIIEDFDTSGTYSNDSFTVFSDSLQAVMPGAILTYTQTNPCTISIAWQATFGTAPLFGFNLTVSDNVCAVPGISEFNFNVSIKPTAQIMADDIICLGDTLMLIGRGGNVVSWSAISGTPLTLGTNYFEDVDGDADTVWVVPDVNSTYVLVTDNQVCAPTDTHSVTLDTQDATIFANDLYCFNESPAPTFTAATPGGVWTAPGVHPTNGTLDLSVVDPGPRIAQDTIELAYTFVSPNGCLSTDTVNFAVANFSAVIDSLPPLCLGDDEVVNLKDWTYFNFGEFISIPSGTANTLGNRLTEDGLLNQEGLQEGLYNIRHVLDTHCAQPYDTIIAVYPPPDAKITEFDPVFCSYDADTAEFFSATEGGFWGGNAVVDPAGFMIPSQVGPGDYSLSYTVTDPVTRCVSVDQVNFKIVRNPPTPGLIYNGPFCAGDKLSRLTADGLRTNAYSWYTDSIASPEALFDEGRVIDLGVLEESIDLWVTQTNADGCESNTGRYFIEVVPLPDVDFIANPFEGTRLPLEVDWRNLTDSALFYRWDFGDGTITDAESPADHIYTELGIYNVNLWADNGVCQNDITKRIIVDAEALANFPNVFTPNGDGVNDKWVPVWDNIDNAEVVIYNRWGNKVYDFNDPANGWDGGNSKEGVYFYILRGIEHSLDATPIQYSGDITLIRE